MKLFAELEIKRKEREAKEMHERYEEHSAHAAQAYLSLLISTLIYQETRRVFRDVLILLRFFIKQMLVAS